MGYSTHSRKMLECRKIRILRIFNNQHFHRPPCSLWRTSTGFSTAVSTASSGVQNSRLPRIRQDIGFPPLASPYGRLGCAAGWRERRPGRPRAGSRRRLLRDQPRPRLGGCERTLREPAQRLLAAALRGPLHVSRLYDPSEQFELLKEGIGVTNAAYRTTPGSGDLRRSDFEGSAERLERIALELKPRWLAFVGKEGVSRNVQRTTRARATVTRRSATRSSSYCRRPRRRMRQCRGGTGRTGSSSCRRACARWHRARARAQWSSIRPTASCSCASRT